MKMKPLAEKIRGEKKMRNLAIAVGVLTVFMAAPASWADGEEMAPVESDGIRELAATELIDVQKVESMEKQLLEGMTVRAMAMAEGPAPLPVVPPQPENPVVPPGGVDPVKPIVPSGGPEPVPAKESIAVQRVKNVIATVPTTLLATLPIGGPPSGPTIFIGPDNPSFNAYLESIAIQLKKEFPTTPTGKTFFGSDVLYGDGLATIARIVAGIKDWYAKYDEVLLEIVVTPEGGVITGYHGHSKDGTCVEYETLQEIVDAIRGKGKK